MIKIIITGGSGFIGTHLAELFQASGISFLNLDITAPKITEHTVFWRNCDILDSAHLAAVFREYQPTHVVHLAARATTDGKSLDDYPDNTIGTKNVLGAIQETPGIQRVIITSSQHVRKPGSGLPKNDSEYNPHGFYGESKVITEELTRKANLACEWVIIRPTTIWGPYHPFLPSGLWRLMSKRLYFHPENDPVVRSYGYVKNTAWLIAKLMNAPASQVNQKTFYIGDEPIHQTQWVDAFSLALAGRPAIKIPKAAIYLLARIGDLLSLFGISFPMNSDRFFNLTTTNPVPIDPIIKQFGQQPFTLQQGIKETVNWLNESRQ